jgi:hypothetical protein
MMMMMMTMMMTMTVPLTMMLLLCERCSTWRTVLCQRTTRSRGRQSRGLLRGISRRGATGGMVMIMMMV